MNKLEIQEVEKLESIQIANYIIDIAQTEICQDKDYCNKLCEIFRTKKSNQHITKD